MRESLIAFANAQTSSSNAVDWVSAMRESLETLLPGVDRISVNINRGCNVNAGPFKDVVVSSAHAIVDRSLPPATQVVSTPDRSAVYFQDLFRRAGRDVNMFRSPICVNLSAERGAYLGSVVLWQLHTSQPIDPSLIETLESVRGLLQFLFSAAIVRFQRMHPQYSAAIRSIHRLGTFANLSRREREVFLGRFQGKSNAAIADELNISEATVRRHIRSIGTRLRKFNALQIRVVGIPLSGSAERTE